MRSIVAAFGRALLSQLRFRMLMLTALPFLFSVLIWGVVLWFALQPMANWLHAYFVEHDLFSTAGGMLDSIGMGAIKTIVVPLIAMWVLLPLMIITALIFVGMIAMPVVVRHVGNKHYPRLEARKGGSFFGSLWMSTSSFVVFIVLWLATLPLSLFPPLTFIVQPVLWGWLTYRVMAYDALADHADAEERQTLLRAHRWQLLLIGASTGALGALPTLLWLGGPLSFIFFPLLAAVAIWLYVLVFIFTGLWFQHYCLDALTRHRAQRGELQPAAAISKTPDADTIE
ncbi:MAG TPA: EI24 domain-containing protein [Oxalicibacterium sp.]|jgi:hypothetical protein|nr:EI24 domain-containing protein [Oxalicibacterium sp.]